MELDPNLKATPAAPFLLGLCGSIVALKGTPGQTWTERLFNVFCGTMTAGFLSPAIAEYFSLASPNMQFAASFVVGLFGLNFVAMLTAWIRDAKLSDIPFFNRKGE